MGNIERDDWITATTDKAHAENWAGIHSSGFCKACANVYTALNLVATDQLAGAVEAERERILALILDLAEQQDYATSMSWKALWRMILANPEGQYDVAPPRKEQP